MNYPSTVRGRFLSRPNRFIAVAEIAGKEVCCHVKNTGRCRELLTCGADLILEDHGGNAARKTRYSVVGVYKNGNLFNMDSQAPNKVWREWLEEKCPPEVFLKPEWKIGNSRFDFYLRGPEGQQALMEVKGVTLEEDGLALFPDAPTLRGVKHLQELTRLTKEGYICYVVFVLQMKGAAAFQPNRRTHPEFAAALEEAVQAGVNVLVYDCEVTESSLKISRPVPFSLGL